MLCLDVWAPSYCNGQFASGFRVVIADVCSKGFRVLDGFTEGVTLGEVIDFQLISTVAAGSSAAWTSIIETVFLSLLNGLN